MKRKQRIEITAFQRQVARYSASAEMADSQSSSRTRNEDSDNDGEVITGENLIKATNQHPLVDVAGLNELAREIQTLIENRNEWHPLGDMKIRTDSRLARLRRSLQGWKKRLVIGFKQRRFTAGTSEDSEIAPRK